MVLGNCRTFERFLGKSSEGRDDLACCAGYRGSPLAGTSVENKTTIERWESTGKELLSCRRIDSPGRWELKRRDRNRRWMTMNFRDRQIPARYLIGVRQGYCPDRGIEYSLPGAILPWGEGRARECIRSDTRPSTPRSPKEKGPRPEGLRRFWLVALLLVGSQSAAAMLPSSRLATSQNRGNKLRSIRPSGE